MVTGAQMKAEGVKKGFPDIELSVPCGRFHGLFIELKRREGGRVSPEQSEWLNRLSEKGYRAVVCYGWHDAKTVIEQYLALGAPCG